MASTGTLTNRKAVKENGWKGEVRALREEYNKLLTAVSYMMPGVVLTTPACKTGTTSAKTWRNEAFTYVARGLKESKAATETAMTGLSVAASKEAWLVMTVAAGGTLTITKAADQTIGTILLPQAPDNEVIVAYLQIVTGTTGYTAVTDDLAVAAQIITKLTFVNAPAVQTVNA